MPRNKGAAKKLARSGNPPCVYCGREAVEFDHYPPVSFFDDEDGDIWPEGFKFPSCRSCNNDSSLHDLIVAVLVRVGPGVEKDDVAFKRWSQLFTRLTKLHPKIAREMFESENAEERRAETRAKFGAELSALYVPPLAQRAIAIFAAKLTKALHYIHSGKKRLAEGSSIRFRWYSNQSLFEGEGRTIPEGIAVMLGLSGPVKRETRNLKDQFDYNYAMSADGSIAIYYCFFRRSFAFISFAAIDGAVLERAVDKLRATIPTGTKDALERIDWPNMPA